MEEEIKLSSLDEDLFTQLEKLFWHLSKETSYMWRRISEKYFPESQSHILYLLDRKGPKKMSEIADSLHLTAGAISIASDKLIDNGYIKRARDDNDRRVVYLKLTAKGKKALEDIKQEGHKVMTFIFSDLSNDELKRLISTYKQASEKINLLYKEYD